VTFQAPGYLTLAFATLTLGVVAAWIPFASRAAPPGAGRRWTVRAVLFGGSWLTGHGVIVRSGILEGAGPPPHILLYLVPTLATAAVVGASSLGARLATVPLLWLVGLQSFRLPLELLLHELYLADAVPRQMTWSGLNFDVLTGLSALLICALGVYRDPPARLVFAWNVMGTVLLITVLAIAVTSAPGPLRAFQAEPPLLLPFHLPFAWIVSVHVWTAIVGHVVIFRALSTRRGVGGGTTSTGFGTLP